jgi:hypothetical protein
MGSKKNNYSIYYEEDELRESNLHNFCLDVFVKLQNGPQLTLYFATPEIISHTSTRKTKFSFPRLHTNYRIRLSKEVIYETIEHYSEDQLKLHHYFEEIPSKILDLLETRQQTPLMLINKYLELNQKTLNKKNLVIDSNLLLNFC